MEMAIWIQNYSRKSDFESGVKLNRVKSRGVGKEKRCVCVGGGGGQTTLKTKKWRGNLFRPQSKIKRFFLIFVGRLKKILQKVWVHAPGSYAPEVWLQINITANSIDTCSLSIESEPKDMQCVYEIICFW
jgi:hypothetical protein